MKIISRNSILTHGNLWTNFVKIGRQRTALHTWREAKTPQYQALKAGAIELAEMTTHFP